MLIGRPLAKVLDIVSGAVAFVAVAFIAVFYINLKFGFITGDALASLTRVKDISLLVVLGLSGLAFALRRNFILFIAFAVVAIVAAVFIFMA